MGTAPIRARNSKSHSSRRSGGNLEAEMNAGGVKPIPRQKVKDENLVSFPSTDSPQKEKKQSKIVNENYQQTIVGSINQSFSDDPLRSGSDSDISSQKNQNSKEQKHGEQSLDYMQLVEQLKRQSEKEDENLKVKISEEKLIESAAAAQVIIKDTESLEIHNKNMVEEKVFGRDIHQLHAQAATQINKCDDSSEIKDKTTEKEHEEEKLEEINHQLNGVANLNQFVADQIKQGSETEQNTETFKLIDQKEAPLEKKNESNDSYSKSIDLNSEQRVSIIEVQEQNNEFKDQKHLSENAQNSLNQPNIHIQTQVFDYQEQTTHNEMIHQKPIDQSQDLDSEKENYLEKTVEIESSEENKIQSLDDNQDQEEDEMKVEEKPIEDVIQESDKDKQEIQEDLKNEERDSQQTQNSQQKNQNKEHEEEGVLEKSTEINQDQEEEKDDHQKEKVESQIEEKSDIEDRNESNDKVIDQSYDNKHQQTIEDKEEEQHENKDSGANNFAKEEEVVEDQKQDEIKENHSNDAIEEDQQESQEQDLLSKSIDETKHGKVQTFNDVQEQENQEESHEKQEEEIYFKHSDEVDLQNDLKISESQIIHEKILSQSVNEEKEIINEDMLEKDVQVETIEQDHTKEQHQFLIKVQENQQHSQDQSKEIDDRDKVQDKSQDIHIQDEIDPKEDQSKQQIDYHQHQENDSNHCDRGEDEDIKGTNESNEQQNEDKSEDQDPKQEEEDVIEDQNKSKEDSDQNLKENSSQIKDQTQQDNKDEDSNVVKQYLNDSNEPKEEQVSNSSMSVEKTNHFNQEEQTNTQQNLDLTLDNKDFEQAIIQQDALREEQLNKSVNDDVTSNQEPNKENEEREIEGRIESAIKEENQNKKDSLLNQIESNNFDDQDLNLQRVLTYKADNEQNILIEDKQLHDDRQESEHNDKSQEGLKIGEIQSIAFQSDKAQIKDEEQEKNHSQISNDNSIEIKVQDIQESNHQDKQFSENQIEHSKSELNYAIEEGMEFSDENNEELINSSKNNQMFNFEENYNQFESMFERESRESMISRGEFERNIRQSLNEQNNESFNQSKDGIESYFLHQGIEEHGIEKLLEQADSQNHSKNNDLNDSAFESDGEVNNLKNLSQTKREGTLASNQNDVEFEGEFYGDFEHNRVEKIKPSHIIDEAEEDRRFERIQQRIMNRNNEESNEQNSNDVEILQSRSKLSSNTNTSIQQPIGAESNSSFNSQTSSFQVQRVDGNSSYSSASSFQVVRLGSTSNYNQDQSFTSIKNLGEDIGNNTNTSVVSGRSSTSGSTAVKNFENMSSSSRGSRRSKKGANPQTNTLFTKQFLKEQRQQEKFTESSSPDRHKNEELKQQLIAMGDIVYDEIEENEYEDDDQDKRKTTNKDKYSFNSGEVDNQFKSDDELGHNSNKKTINIEDMDSENEGEHETGRDSGDKSSKMNAKSNRHTTKLI